MPFKISQKYHNTDWTALALTDEKSPKWIEGIRVIRDRFDSRFFNQIDLIKDEEFSGFLVMSIDCLLIETLMQFYLGVDNTDLNYKGRQKDSFKDFFQQSKQFKVDFAKDQTCWTFHSHFRNGLLHQAQTKQKSLIKISRTNLIELTDKKNEKEGLIIDRGKFHEKLSAEFEDYLEKLDKNEVNFRGENLRLKAIDKMDIICLE